jgi:16S rRNA (cytosine1402-N4)-methyltransferase
MQSGPTPSFLFALLMICLHLTAGLRPLCRPRYWKSGLRTATGNSVTSDDQYSYHVPVMKEECCKYLNIVPGGIYVDCTLGGGGHTKAILDRGGKVIGIDQDPDAIARASGILSNYIASGDCEIVQTNFRNIRNAINSSKLAGTGTDKGGLVDGVLMDLGVSSFQINEGSRGFAISQDGPLDMRMNKGQADGAFDPDGERLLTWRGKKVISAYEIINTWDTTAIADVLYNYGDETRSRVLAREIVSARPLNTTADLVRVISSRTSFKERNKTLARCFQALRIVVNDEIGALEEALSSMHECIRDNGAFVVMSYHSLEDRRVKQLFRSGQLLTTTENENGDSDSEQDEDRSTSVNPWQPVFKGAKGPSKEETEINKRSRSAKLRAATRIPRAEEGTNGGKKIRGKGGFLGAKQLAKLARDAAGKS